MACGSDGDGSGDGGMKQGPGKGRIDEGLLGEVDNAAIIWLGRRRSLTCGLLSARLAGRAIARKAGECLVDRLGSRKA
jgi:hypothetical protein